MNRLEKSNKIDFLRGCAILLVIFVHVGGKSGEGSLFNYLSEIGRFGVQMFFVMSAYTLCMSIDGSNVNIKYYVEFMIRRFYRIAPMYYIGGLFYFAVTCLFIFVFGKTPFTSLSGYNTYNIITNVAFIHGFYPPSNNNIVPGGWSIGCEFIFYAIFPYIYKLNIKYNYSGYIICLIMYLILLFLISSFPRFVGLSGFLYYSFPNQFVCFFVGMELYRYRDLKINKFYSSLVIVLCVFLIYCFLGVEYSWIFLPVLASVATVGLNYSLGRREVRGIVENIGEVSYSMYLVHFVFVWIIARPFNIIVKKYDLNEVFYLLIYGVVCCITYFVSKLTYNLIEKKFIKIGKSVVLSVGSKIQVF